MLNLDAQTVAAALPRLALVDALNTAFLAPLQVPPRAHHDIDAAGDHPGTLLLMPAWSKRYIGVKIVTVFPGNGKLGIPAVAGSYLLLDAKTGQPVAMLDGTELTLQRTSAASALASTYLSRNDASRLLMVGTGNLAPHLIEAHAAVRNIKSVCIWGRRTVAAESLVDQFASRFDEVRIATDLEASVASADIISCATTASTPLIEGAWLKPGQHLDLVGAFKPDMAEADVTCVERSRVFVDTRAGALSEAGEIIQAIGAGAFSAADIGGSLRQLAAGDVQGRCTRDEITLFKSVGTALEDLAAAELAIDNLQDNSSHGAQ